MIANEQKKTEETFKALFLEQKQRAAVESELAKQRGALRERAVFLERLQMCMGEGPAADRLNKQQQELQSGFTKLDAEKREFIKQQAELEQKTKALSARVEFAERKDAALKQALQVDASHEALIETRARDLESHAEAMQHAEQEIQQRLAALNQREAELVARQLAAGKVVDDLRDQQASFAESREQEREFHAMKDKAECAPILQCGTCAANPKCGWCAQSADGEHGQCLPHNVNAKSDGLTSGTCTIQNWNSKVVDRMTALNLNVFGGDYSDKEQRASTIFNTIISAKYPDFIAFQEVSEWFMTLLKDQAWFRNYYHAVDFNAPKPPGGLLIMSRFPINSTTYQEAYSPCNVAVDSRPRLLLAEIQLNGKTITVGTTTLDWRDAPSRVRGLKFVRGLTRNIENFLFMGDFNFDDGAQPETAHLSPSWMDLWPRLHNVKGGAPDNKITRGPNRYGYTWDPRTNWYARVADVNAKPSRIDRVYMRSRILLPREIHIVGCAGPDYLCQDPPPPPSSELIPWQKPREQTPGQAVFGSPHYGLLTSFSMFLSHC